MDRGNTPARAAKPKPSARAALAPERAQASPSRVGTRIQSLRRERKITLERLAGLTGFTKGYLSKVENSDKPPPIGSLMRIAVALGTNINEFLWGGIRPDDVSTISVVKARDRQPVELAQSRFGYGFASVAFKRRRKAMEPMVCSFPKQVAIDTFFQHEGEQLLFVLTGKLHFEIGSRDQLTRWLLEPGDCIYFDSRLPHRGYAVGGDATGLVVLSAPPGAEAAPAPG